MLNERQKLFVLEYQRTPNATQAAISAGYSPKTAYSIGQRLLKNVEIQQALQHGLHERTETLIADVKQIQQFWTQCMNDSDADMKHRLRASELLGKSLGAFIEQSKLEVQETNSLADIMLETYRDKL